MSKKLFKVQDVQTTICECIVKAENEQQAINIAMSGNVDWKESKTNNKTSIEQLREDK